MNIHKTHCLGTMQASRNSQAMAVHAEKEKSGKQLLLTLSVIVLLPAHLPEPSLWDILKGTSLPSTNDTQ